MTRRTQSDLRRSPIPPPGHNDGQDAARLTFEAADQGADDIVLDGRNDREVVGSDRPPHQQVEMEVLVRPRDSSRRITWEKSSRDAARTLQPIGGTPMQVGGIHA